MKTPLRTSWSASLLALCITTSSLSALAQTPEERAGARSAARAGVEAYDAGRYAESLDRFNRAEKLVHAPTHLLYIARCNVKLGFLVRAQEAYQQLIREQLGAGAPQAFRDAQASAERELAEIAPKIGSLTVTINGLADPSHATVTMDGSPISSALIGIPFPADPGKHVFVVSAEGYTSQTVERSLPEGGKDTVELKLQATSSAPGLAANTAQPESHPGDTQTASSPGEPAPSSTRSSLRIPAYAALGVGVLGIGAGTYFFLARSKAKGDASDAFDACAPDCTASERRHIDDLDSKAASRGTFSAVSFIVGGVGAIAGVTLLVLDAGHSDASKSASKSQLRGWVGPGSLGLSGSF
jgi:hypothetical protein